MRKRTAVLAALGALLLFVAGGRATAAGGTVPTGTLFVASNPLESVVVVDGKALDRLSPLIIRDMTAGRHTIEVTKRGYSAQTLVVDVAANKVQSVTFSLKPQFVDPVFAGTQSISFEGRSYPYRTGSYAIPTGTYEIARNGSSVVVTPVFPGQLVLTTLDILTPILLGASGVVSAQAYFTYTNQGDAIASAIPVYILTALAATFDVSLRIQRSQYQRAFTISPISAETREAAAHFARGGELLASGDIPDAIEQYADVIRSKVDSVIYAQSLYQLGKLHSILGNSMLAAAEFRLIIDRYPLPELYDKACKSLADIYVEQKDYKSALSVLDRMVFLDPLYPKAQIDAYRKQIETKTGAGA